MFPGDEREQKSDGWSKSGLRRLRRSSISRSLLQVGLEISGGGGTRIDGRTWRNVEFVSEFDPTQIRIKHTFWANLSGPIDRT